MVVKINQEVAEIKIGERNLYGIKEKIGIM